MKRNVEITRYENGDLMKMEDIVLKEYNLDLYVEGEKVTSFSTIEEGVKELIVGHLYTDEWINGREDIMEIDIDYKRGVAEVGLREFVRRDDRANRLTSVAWEPEDLLRKMNNMLEGTDLFISTGNIHNVMIMDGKDNYVLMEDIGRYNAMDKAIGAAILEDMDLEDSIVFTSGRIPSDIVKKIVRSRIPVVVSRSAPTDMSLRIAEEYGLSIIGFVKSKRMNIYTDFR